MVLINFTEMGEQLSTKAKKTLALAGAGDEHSVETAILVKQREIADPILIGDAARVRELLTELGQKASDYEIIQASSPKETAQITVKLAKEKKVDCILKGGIQTGDLISAVINKETGIKTQNLLSHLTVLEVPSYHKILSVTDGAIVLAPSLEQKLVILDNALRVLRWLGYDCPKVGILESNELVNPKIPSSVEAAILKEMNLDGRITGCQVEGPISLDLATDSRACREKGYQSPVGGDVDLLLCPFITVANAMVKAIQTFVAGTKTAGVVVGASVPIILISRASSPEEKANSIKLATIVG
ncbi:MAG: phosphate butyryltransferase [Deltaproteobacteria bacterium]|jgi:phosphate butyryltransferase|nr:phosphate butyryltransferase [Deltaproteobacteria bacterium]